MLAEAVDTSLHIFDSFEGLPDPLPEDGTYATTRGVVNVCAAGHLRLPRLRSRGNIQAHGVLDRCHLYKGYFEQTRPGSDLKPGCAFIDVDLVSSAHTCIQYLWPNLAPGGRLFFHDVIQIGFCLGITDAEWWEQTVGQRPPMLWGAGYGCGDMAPNVGYFEKT